MDGLFPMTGNTQMNEVVWLSKAKSSKKIFLASSVRLDTEVISFMFACITVFMEWYKNIREVYEVYITF